MEKVTRKFLSGDSGQRVFVPARKQIGYAVAYGDVYDCEAQETRPLLSIVCIDDGRCVSLSVEEAKRLFLSLVDFIGEYGEEDAKTKE